MGTSLVVQWVGICLPMQGSWVPSLVWENPTCLEATKQVSSNYWAYLLQLLKPACLEPLLDNVRSHCNEKPGHCNEEQPLLSTTRESPCTAMKTQWSQKKKKNHLKKTKNIKVFWTSQYNQLFKELKPVLPIYRWRILPSVWILENKKKREGREERTGTQELDDHIQHLYINMCHIIHVKAAALLSGFTEQQL